MDETQLAAQQASDPDYDEGYEAEMDTNDYHPDEGILI